MNSHLASDGVWFPNWAVDLARVRLKDLERRAYRLAIVGYLAFCKRWRQRATVASARLFMAEVEARRRLSRSQLEVWKAGLNWFFTAAAKQTSGPLTSILSPEGERKGEGGVELVFHGGGEANVRPPHLNPLPRGGEEGGRRFFAVG